MKNVPIGQYLVDNGLISKDQLEEVLRVQKESQGTKRFGEIIVELKFITEVRFAQALASKLNVPYIDLAHTNIDIDAVEKIPEALAKKYTIIAIGMQGKRITVATDDPINFGILEDIKSATGLDTFPVLATKSAINKAIGKHYSMQNVDSVLEGVSQFFEGEAQDEESKERVESAPIVKLATTIVENAYRADATDIHIEPFKSYTHIRIRINGDLVELMNISNTVHAALTTRIKLISGMNIAEKRIPQDGRFTQIIDGETLDVRVSSIPTVHGEKIVIRLLTVGQVDIRGVRNLGMSDYNCKLFEDMLRCPHGVILVTGPTGSGKTTTLYAALSQIAKPHINVITVEDPVEKTIDGINQVQVNTKAGMTFSAALRSILRQDPDIIMVGEMRDNETAEIGVRAAITGHLVLSTLHTNDAASTIVRLIDMDIPAYMVATSLIGVVAQRLVKLLCPKCKQKRMSTEEENKLMRIDNSIEVFDATGVVKDQDGKEHTCTECNGAGYKGRSAIHEIILCSGPVGELIASGAGKEQIENLARENGTRLLRDSATERVARGETSIDELIRVTYAV
jgi:type IV pilus assembly protein PilB